MDEIEFHIQITAVMRNELNNVAGLDWLECDRIIERVQEHLSYATSLEDDVGRTWTLTFVPSEVSSEKHNHTS